MLESRAFAHKLRNKYNKMNFTSFTELCASQIVLVICSEITGLEARKSPYSGALLRLSLVLLSTWAAPLLGHRPDRDPELVGLVCRLRSGD